MIDRVQKKYTRPRLYHPPLMTEMAAVVETGQDHLGSLTLSYARPPMGHQQDPGFNDCLEIDTSFGNDKPRVPLLQNVLTDLGIRTQPIEEKSNGDRTCLKVLDTNDFNKVLAKLRRLGPNSRPQPEDVLSR